MTPILPEFPETEPGYSPAPGPQFTSLTDVAGDVCLPVYQDQENSLPLSLYKVTEVDYLASADHPDHCDPASVAAGDCRVPVYEVSDPRLDLTTGQVHIHIDLSEHSSDQCEVLNLSSDLSAGGDTDPVLASYYDMSSSVTMDESEASSAHSSYPYFNGGAGAGASLGSGTGSSSSSPYGLTNRAYSDPASAYNLYSQYYGAAYPYGMNFGGSGSSSSTSGFATKGEYGSSYYGSYASWSGNPYR